MAKIVERTEPLDASVKNQIKNLFGTVQNAFRHLKLFETRIPYSTFQRMMRGEGVRADDLLTVETRWDQFASEHSFDKDSLDYDSDIRQSWQNVGRSRPGGGVYRVKGARIVQEDETTWSEEDLPDFFE